MSKPAFPCVTFLLSFSLLVLPTALLLSQDKPGAKVPIQVNPPGKVNPELVKDRFDPENPPEGAPQGADAYTRCQAKIHCEADGLGTTSAAKGPCDVTVKVTKVTVTKGLKIIQFLPDAPGEDATAEEKKRHEVLVAHENAHRDLCKEVFDLISDKIIKDVF